PLRALVLGVLLLTSAARAQYNAQAGQSAPAAEQVRIETKDAKGNRTFKVEERPAKLDDFGNAQSTKYDLAVDGAFTGQTVLVLDYYGQSFEGPTQALKQKGFSVVLLRNTAPSPKELTAML